MKIANKCKSKVSFCQADVPSNEIATQLLLAFNSLEQRLEVSSTKAIEVVSLDDLNEDSRAIHHVLCHLLVEVHRMAQKRFANWTYLSEQLEKVTTLVKVNQDI